MSQREQPQDSSDPIFSSILAECPELWDVVEQFARGLPGQMEEMQQALEHASYDVLIERARLLMKAGRGHGFPELSEYAAALERAARGKIIDSLESQLADLRDMTQQIQAGLEVTNPIDGPSARE